MRKMLLRLPVIFVLIIPTFVGSSPVSEAGVPDKPEVAPVTAATVNAKIETTAIPANNDRLSVAPSARPDENNKESSNNTKIPVPPNIPTETIPQHIAKPSETKKHRKCNSTNEPEDMTDCYDSSNDSGEVTEVSVTQSAAESTTIASAVINKTEANKTESQTPKPSPDKIKKVDDKEKEIKKKVDIENNEKGKNEKEGKQEESKKNHNVTIVLLNSTETTVKGSYETARAETSDVKNTNGTGDDSKPATPPATINGTATSSNTVAPLDKVPNVKPVAVVAEAKSANRNKSMPSGIIALVTAISFGVAIAIVYIGMIVWRRYVEYRYGHRELLVNELEFDTNDLRHFEL